MAQGFKRYLGRELKKKEREEYRRTLKALREKARAEKADRAKRLRAAKRACNRRVGEAKRLAQAEFQRARELALEAQKKATALRHAARQAKREAAREKCRLDREHIEAEAKAKIEQAEREAAAERAFRAELAGMAKAQRSKPRVTSRERRDESDDEVRDNLPAELLLLWEREKRRIKATPKRTRTEAFLEWVHEHPDAQLEAQLGALPSDEEMRRAEAAYMAERRGMVEAEVPF